jgi:hypothetical protein
MFKRVIETLSEIPDHVTAIVVLAIGSLLTLCRQHDTGQALIAAGLAMWKGKQ